MCCLFALCLFSPLRVWLPLNPNFHLRSRYVCTPLWDRCGSFLWVPPFGAVISVDVSLCLQLCGAFVALSKICVEGKLKKSEHLRGGKIVLIVNSLCDRDREMLSAFHIRHKRGPTTKCILRGRPASQPNTQVLPLDL